MEDRRQMVKEIVLEAAQFGVSVVAIDGVAGLLKAHYISGELQGFVWEEAGAANPEILRIDTVESFMMQQLRTGNK